MRELQLHQHELDHLLKTGSVLRVRLPTEPNHVPMGVGSLYFVDYHFAAFDVGGLGAPVRKTVAVKLVSTKFKKIKDRTEQDLIDSNVRKAEIGQWQYNYPDLNAWFDRFEIVEE